jgi:transposase
MIYEEIKEKEKIITKLSKIKIISYLHHLLTYVAQLHKKIKLLEKEISDEKIKKINLKVNCPTSKLPEWEKKSPEPKKNPDEKKKKKKGKKRKGSGNKNKEKLIPTTSNTTKNEDCPHCGHNLRNEKPFEIVTRIIEDINEFSESTDISKENQERVKCPKCKKKITAKSEAALPKSDIGLRATILLTYLWVWAAISLPKLTDYLNSFFNLTVSTAGISKMMIRVGDILKPVYFEILEDIKKGAIIYADETGWRVKGKLHWLWIFANKKSSFYWPDKSRGGPVIEKLLGTCFQGLLISDAWHAYLKIQCEKQTCMAHIFRKIRKLKDAFPQYYSVLQFYEKLKKIIKDAENLQTNRKKIGESLFKANLKNLHLRLDILLDWKKPNEILFDIIKKVKRQRDYILTFVEHSEAESHNNYSEYIIKKGILKRKVSGGSTSFKGLFAFSVLISIYQTCHLRKIKIRHFMKKTLVHYIKTGKPMLLSEYEKQYLKN